MRFARLSPVVAIILFGLCCTASGSQPPAPVVEKIETQLPSADGAAKPVDLGTLANGMVWYFPFDGHLTGWNPNGTETNAHLQRTTPAYLPDLTRTESHEARYWEGVFGQSIMIEYGICAAGMQAGVNQLPEQIASADDAAKGFRAVGGAKLGKTKGILGGALTVAATSAGGGIVTEGAAVPKTNAMSYSVYLRGPAGQTLDLAVTVGSAPAGKADVKLTGEWQRASVDWPVKLAKGEKAAATKTPPVALKITARAPCEFAVDALMLESHHGYTGRASASSWIDPGVRRPADLVQFGLPADAISGTIAFRAKMFGRMAWRNLLTIGQTHGWDAQMRLDVRNNNLLQIALTNKVAAQATIPEPGAWHQYALTWNRGRVAVYLDGKRVIEAVNEKRKFDQIITLGGVATNFSPALRANAYFDELAHWDRALSVKEVAALAALAGPIAAGMNLGVTLTDLEPIHVYARDDLERFWRVSVVNRTTQPLAGATVRYSVKDAFGRDARVPDVPPGHRATIALPWSPARLIVGKYKMHFVLSAGGKELRALDAAAEIAPARVPASNVQVINWSGPSEPLYELGVTAAGLVGSADGPKEHEVSLAVSSRLYVQLLQSLHAKAKTDLEHFYNSAGKPRGVDAAAPGPRRDVIEKAKRLAERLAHLPDVRYMIINSEHQTIWDCDFRPASIREAKKRFRFDMSPWAGADEKKLWAVVHPMGRLSPAWGKIEPPAGGIVARDEPSLRVSSLVARFHVGHRGDAQRTDHRRDQTARAVDTRHHRADPATPRRPSIYQT